ncbi:MAG: DHH family phosphoesterase [Candidatus Tyloplasma litorale]|nr:MAG: DHH family phosphoesterase [Mycoplasmatales bacterium]
MKGKKNTILLIVLATISTLSIILLLIFNVLASIDKNYDDNQAFFIVFYAILFVFSLFIYGILIYHFYINRNKKIVDLVKSINSIGSTQEEIFEVGSVFYDDEQYITFITPWLQKEGLNSYLGKKVSTLKINLNSNKPQKLNIGYNKWEVTSAKRSKAILFKDVTFVSSLIQTIEKKQKAVISIHTSLTKKINFNDSIKADATLKINQVIRNWVTKHGGILNSSISNEGTISGIFDWVKGQRDVESETILESIKKANPRLVKDITISIGVAYGDGDYADLLESSLKSLEVSKSRGGDQTIIMKPNGFMEYVGNSSTQAVSDGNIMNIRQFYTEFISDIKQAREVFISSHKMADLDALGSSLGLLELIKDYSNHIYFIIDDFDKTTLKLFRTLPKTKRDLFITEREAFRNISNRSHMVITDTSILEYTQAYKLSKNLKPKNISIIDHHRLSKGTDNYVESKMLIDTTSSSTSELIVEMLKLDHGTEVHSSIDPMISTSLLAGIKLDTKQLSKNIQSSTFDAVSFLINNDANINFVDSLFKPPQSLILFEKEALTNLQRFNNGIVFTFIKETTKVNEEVTSMIADKILEYEGISAAFVLAKIKGNKFKLSARSHNNYNVQSLAEKLGGGGHFNSSACTWPGTINYDNLKKKIVSEITK